jgi:hypothetical protein
MDFVPACTAHLEAALGLDRIVALYDRSSASYPYSLTYSVPLLLKRRCDRNPRRRWRCTSRRCRRGRPASRRWCVPPFCFCQGRSKAVSVQGSLPPHSVPSLAPPHRPGSAGGGARPPAGGRRWPPCAAGKYLILPSLTQPSTQNLRVIKEYKTLRQRKKPRAAGDAPPATQPFSRRIRGSYTVYGEPMKCAKRCENDAAAVFTLPCILVLYMGNQ